MEVFRFVAAVASHGLGNGQAATRDISGIGKLSLRRLLFDDCSSCTLRSGVVAILICFGFRHLVGRTRRKSGCRLACSVFQSKGRNTVCKLHITEFPADRLITKRYGEVEVFRFVAAVASHGLGNGKAAGCYTAQFRGFNPISRLVASL